MTLSPANMTAVVLAGGFGTRVRHLLGDLPKPMAPVDGRPFVEWVIRYLARQGVRRVVLSTGYRSEVIEAHFREQPVESVSVLCVPEAEPLGTGGGFLNAARKSGERPTAWLVLNGDSLAFAELSIAATLVTGRVAGVIVGRAVPDGSRFGALETDASGILQRFAEKRPGAAVINAGIYLLRAHLLSQFPARCPLSFEHDVFPALTRRGVLLKVHATHAPFLDIGTEESLPQAEAFVRKHAAEFFEV